MNELMASLIPHFSKFYKTKSSLYLWANLRKEKKLLQSPECVPCITQFHKVPIMRINARTARQQCSNAGGGASSIHRKERGKVQTSTAYCILAMPLLYHSSLMEAALVSFTCCSRSTSIWVLVIMPWPTFTSIVVRAVNESSHLLRVGVRVR